MQSNAVRAATEYSVFHRDPCAGQTAVLALSWNQGALAKIERLANETRFLNRTEDRTLTLAKA